MRPENRSNRSTPRPGGGKAQLSACARLDRSAFSKRSSGPKKRARNRASLPHRLHSHTTSRTEVTAMSELPETFKPRPYQAEAIKALIAGWQGPHNRLAVVLPTGAGKTVVFSNLIDEL